ncbi:MAG: hypothetical protein PHN69_02095 [Candidatus Pacebacteria bacterium]|nr:hypothetical protein [Candidatus Paceibacterota bacterium]
MHSIKDFSKKIKSFLLNIKDRIYNEETGLSIKNDLFIIILIFLVGLSSFGLGKISTFERRKIPISILNKQTSMYASVAESIKTTDSQENTKIQEKGIIVASKSGKKYYYPWCSGVDRIKEENKVWFNSVEEAKARGLTPASGCIGLK